MSALALRLLGYAGIGLSGLALAGCQQQGGSKESIDQPLARSSVDYHLDQQALPPILKFSPADIDPQLDACTDLNAYVNQRWINRTQLPDDMPRIGSFLALQERSQAVEQQLAEQAAAAPHATGIDRLIGDFWQSGMNQARIDQQGLAPVAPTLSAINRIKTRADVVTFLFNQMQEGQGIVFNLGAGADFKDPKRNILYVQQSGLGLPDSSYYNNPDHQDDIEAYQQYLTRLFSLSGRSQAEATGMAKAVVGLEQKLAAHTVTQEQVSRDAKLYYNPLTPSAADELTPNIPWSRLFKQLGLHDLGQASFITPDYFRSLDRLLDSSDVSVWRDYLRARVLDDAAPYLSRAFVNANFDFADKHLKGQKVLAPRWKRVVKAINGNIGDAMGERYVQTAFSPEAKRKMEALVDNLRQALKQRIEHVDWMSAETRQRALEKWKTFRAKIGYPDKWRSWQGLTSSPDGYLANIRAAEAFNFKWDMQKVGKPVDPNDWGMTPQTVNAYYNPNANEIVFPAAILQPPFFDANADKAFNYGGIGAVIGHEMTHGYDDQGARFGPDGSFENWWTPADKKRFDERSKALVEQFNHYRVMGKPVNGHLTLGENIADLGGLNTAYDALQQADKGEKDPMIDGHTRNQNFFLNWATVWRMKASPSLMRMYLVMDPHAPTSIRAKAAPSNMPAFAQAFQCKPGDAMVRPEKDRVAIW